MINNDACVLWQLSAKEKLDDNHFECHLILEYKDRTALSVDINALDNKEKDWLRLTRVKTPFKGFSESDIPIKYNLSLFTSCFMDFDALKQIKPRIKCVYLWIASINQEVGLELVYPLSDLKDVESRASNKIFVQLYPKIPSQRYIDLEDDLEEIENFRDLLDRFKVKPKNAKVIEKAISIKQPEIPKKPIAVSKPNSPKQPKIKAKTSQNKSITDNSYDLELLEIVDDVIWGIFSKQDLDDLVEGFRDWERVHGKNTLIARLPKSLADKISNGFDILFWTSGQGVSNMVLDNRPPRHTMVLSLVNTNTASISDGIGYCLQRPTSLDKTWTYQRWHTFECQKNEISKVVSVTF